MTTLNTAFSFLVLFSLCFSSCKKDKETKVENALIGDWNELDLTNNSRSVKFTKEKTFHSVIRGNGSTIMLNGTYQIKLDSLKITATEMLQQEPGKTVRHVPAPNYIYDMATFSVSGDTLTIRYKTYPADAPLPTTAKFIKSFTID